MLALRHGERIRAAVRVIDHGEGQRRGLATEALDVLLSRDEAAIALPLVRRESDLGQRTSGRKGATRPGSRAEEWIEEIAADPDAQWRSPWLTACALHAGAL